MIEDVNPDDSAGLLCLGLSQLPKPELIPLEIMILKQQVLTLENKLKVLEDKLND